MKTIATKKHINLSVSEDVNAALQKLARRDNVLATTKALKLIKKAIVTEDDVVLDFLARERDVHDVRYLSHDRAWNKMKSAYTLRFRAINRDSFHAIQNGAKKVETRAATVRYRDITAGDVITFVCGREKFERRVKRVMLFKTISAMLKKYNVADIAPDFSTEKELRAKYNSFPGYREKIKKFGLIALELK